MKRLLWICMLGLSVAGCTSDAVDDAGETETDVQIPKPILIRWQRPRGLHLPRLRCTDQPPADHWLSS